MGRLVEVATRHRSGGEGPCRAGPKASRRPARATFRGGPGALPTQAPRRRHSNEFARRTTCAAQSARCKAGFTLLELLAALAIVAVVAAVAVPWYRDYVATAREGALGKRIATMAIFQEETRLRTGSYGAGSWDPAAGEESLAAAIGWQPATDDGTTFIVTADADAWTVTAADAGGATLCRVLPANDPCAQNE